MRVMVVLLLGTNQQMITLHKVCLPDRLPLELSISGMRCWESLRSPGHRLGILFLAVHWEGEEALSEAHGESCTGTALPVQLM